MKRSAQNQLGGHSYQNQQMPESSSGEVVYTSEIDCDKCPNRGPWIAKDPNKDNPIVTAICPVCSTQRKFKVDNMEFDGDRIVRVKVRKDQPVGAPILEKKTYTERQNMKHNAQKRDTNGVPEKNTYNGPRIFNMREDVNPQGKNTIGPFTKEREDYKDQHKVTQFAENLEDIKKPDDLSVSDLKTLAKEYSSSIITENAKEDLAKTAAMYPQVSVMPASQNTMCQWCPKLRSSVSMDVCSSKCIDARRIPQDDPSVFETYRDYLVAGGDPNGKIVCGYKEWLKREVDAFYPGWVEDHIKKAGGEVSGSETNFGNRRMNLDDKERRHLPRYPEEFATEKRLEERHNSVPEYKTANAKKNK